MNFSLQSPVGEDLGGPPSAASEIPPRERPVRRRSGLKIPLILGAIVIGAAAVAFSSVPGLGTSVTGLLGSTDDDVLSYGVKKTKLAVTISDRGTLESANNEDVYNEVEGQTTILTIVREGDRVKKGSLVCELDSAALRDSLTNQEIATKRAKADLDQATKTREVAEISLEEYLKGTFPADEQTAEGQIKLTESDLIKAKEKLEWSNKMAAIGYVSNQQNQADKLAREKAEFSLREANKKLEVLRTYTRPKMTKELEANIEKARSDESAKTQTYTLEKQKEEKLRKQIERCKLTAPNDGIVVYAQENNRFGNTQNIIEPGAQVRERQKIFSLPDTSHMRVNTKVHESKIDLISPGLRARVRVDAFANVPYSGTVDSIAPMPDQGSFFSSDIKVYSTLVNIDGEHSNLRPGMTAQVEILVKQLDDVLAVPVQAILEFRGKDHVYVMTEQGPQRRVIQLGTSNDKLVEVKSGIEDGDQVALNPMSLMTEAEKREAFGVSGKPNSASGKDWSAAEAKASDKAKEAGGAGKAGAAKKKRGGMPKLDPAVMEKFKNATPEEKARMIEEFKSKAAAGGFGGPPGGGPPGGGGGGGGGGGRRGGAAGGPGQ